MHNWNIKKQKTLLFKFYYYLIREVKVLILTIFKLLAVQEHLYSILSIDLLLLSVYATYLCTLVHLLNLLSKMHEK